MTEVAAPAENKKPWLSKTLWMNLLMAASSFIPSVGSWMSAHTELVMAGWSALNMALRLITKDKISLQD